MSEATHQNWFQITGQPNFAHYLLPYRGRPNLRFLQIGAYRGDASVWMLENILIGDGCVLVDVDPWGENEDEYHELDNIEPDWDQVRTEYLDRTEPWFESGKVRSHAMTSNDFFGSNIWSDGVAKYDFIYIDGAHDSISVLEDAVHAYRHLKVRGTLGFDDYTWHGASSNPLDAPGPAIDAFRFLYAREMATMVLNGQVWMLKLK